MRKQQLFIVSDNNGNERVTIASKLAPFLRKFRHYWKIKFSCNKLFDIEVSEANLRGQDMESIKLVLK